ncbi:MAG: PspC domain-containing protein, partial [Bacteroidota bacterium]|nr:PspC domain-containing protein [Bacteroidota bacterium]
RNTIRTSTRGATMTNQRLYRSRTNKVFAGVCGGLGEYFDVDPVVMRILLVLLIIFGGTGILLYIAAIIIIPKKPLDFENKEEPAPVIQKRVGLNWFGYILVIGGFLLLLSNLGWFHFFDYFDHAFEYVFPVLLIILGMAVIYYRQSASEQKPNDQQAGAESESAYVHPRTFRRSASDRKIFGVCGGLAKYFGIDPSIMRLLYVILCFASFGAGVLLYLLLAVIVPDDKFIGAQVS